MDNAVATPVNVARQLHALLTRFNQLQAEGMSGQAIWGHLETGTLWPEEAETRAVFIARGLSLLGDVERACAGLREDDLRDMFVHNFGFWSAPFVDAFKMPMSSKPVPPYALSSLASLARELDRSLPSPVAPSEEELKSVRETVSDLREQVATDGTLDEKLRNLILVRLGDIEWALNHVDLLGPDGIQAACDRLAAVLMTQGHAFKNREEGSLFYKLSTTAGQIWTMVGFVDVFIGGGLPILDLVDKTTKGIAP